MSAKLKNPVVGFPKELGPNLCLTLDGRREDYNFDFVLLPESFKA
jgi:hypothetical protein